MEINITINWERSVDRLPEEGAKLLLSGHGLALGTFRKGKFLLEMDPADAVNCLNCGQSPYYEVDTPQFWAPYPEIPGDECLEKAYAFERLSPKEKEKYWEHRMALLKRKTFKSVRKKKAGE